MLKTWNSRFRNNMHIYYCNSCISTRCRNQHFFYLKAMILALLPPPGAPECDRELSRHAPDPLRTRSGHAPDALRTRSRHALDTLQTRRGRAPDALQARSGHAPDVLRTHSRCATRLRRTAGAAAAAAAAATAAAAAAAAAQRLYSERSESGAAELGHAASGTRRGRTWPRSPERIHP